MKCKKCSKKLSGQQTSYCSKKCSRRHLKSLWQKRKREVVNQSKRLWRKRTNYFSRKVWETNNPLKHSAHRKVSNAIRTCKLTKRPCEICNDLETQAHHDDYNFPLRVRWLCIKHHHEIHYPCFTF